MFVFFFFSSRRRHTRFDCDWSSDVCSSDLDSPDRIPVAAAGGSAVLRRDPLLSVQGSAPPDLADHLREAIPVRGAMRAAVRRSGGRAVGTAVFAAGFLTARPPDRPTAQDSPVGIRGLGTPGRWESVRSRSSGGAFGPFDPLSPLMEAPLADISQLTATAAGGPPHRDAQLGDTATQLRATRFPLMGVAGRVAPRLVISGGFTTY